MKAILQHMLIQIHNTLSGKKDTFEPLEKNKVGIYNCGPTVYDSAHIGNMRTNVSYDIVRRVFEYNGYFVNQVMNITDIDDKTIKRSQRENISLEKLTKHYESLFLEDINSLNILRPNHLLRASDHIKEMIEMISILLEKEIAYRTKDGIYFSIGLFKEYGKLAKLNIPTSDTSTLKERIINDEYEKENPRDFALWKFFSVEDNNNEGIKYPSPFGEGRPGWSIECSAMATLALGPTIDIHMGGTDLIFPHHTNEIAQSESANEKTFVRYWIHTAFINVNSDKMSKSKGTFLKLNDLVEAGISPLAYRYWLMTSHYRSQVNFTIETVRSAQTAFIRLIEIFVRLGEVENEHVHKSANPIDYSSEFLSKINDDFNMPEALALTWDLIKDHSIESKEKIKLLLDFDKVFGFGLKSVAEMKIGNKNKIPHEITVLAEAREDARKNKEWKKADALRLEIESRNYLIKDSSDGFKILEK